MSLANAPQGRALPPSFDSKHFRAALGRFPTGVTIVTTSNSAGQPLGLTVSSFNSVSLEPPLVLWSLALTSGALDVFKTTQRYAIHVLASGQAGLAHWFAGRGVADRFAKIAWHRNDHGVPLLSDGFAARFECFNRSRYIEGDHMIMVGQVEHCEYTDRMPLVFHAGGFDLTPKAEQE